MVFEGDRRSASESRSIDKAPGGEWSWGFLLVQTSVTIIQRLKGNVTTCSANATSMIGPWVAMQATTQ
jgi:hypothetical protein